MEKTKIIHIITRLDKGGSAETTLQTVSLLDHKKYELFLIRGLSLESNMSNMERESVERDLSLAEAKSIKVFALPSLVRRLSFKNDLLAFISIYRLIKRIRPHIVHTHTSKAGLLGRLAAFLARVPVIIHTPHGHVFHSYYGPFMTRIFIIAERILSLMTDKIAALTDRERDEHLEQGVASIEKYTIIHSGVMLQQIMNMNIDIETGKKEFGIPQNSNVIGVVGRLVPIKGHKYLVSAAKRIIKEFDNTVFVFVGDGYLESRLEKQAESLGVRKHIIFAGWRKDVIEVLDLFDILVLPSLNEGMGKVLIEGMALGKPIVASRVGGIIDLVKNGDNGILVSPRDSDALGEAILTLIRNKNLAQRLGEYGKANISPEYDTFVMVRQIEEMYENMLSRKCS
ncbi:MAG: glycosyltransferase family 4 protein [Candidatus Scalindua sp.]|nr:glycosyltransferase family 4 protein [Candidatus Scalindua sp.]MBT5305076.1 glycosyltransferase family 4 protein [Candidatus Scalindua sp.]MBT6046342.1 glycosyltransferase family 4 protein [Candidatus Scalindua sp.]MBT6230317.1 glycosyltransferase family 4 protein [Candidatus Scalindua sp.]MBT6563235.1 glycosyltransferase family 4 protein [Candidatus Scalindua sp.]